MASWVVVNMAMLAVLTEGQGTNEAQPEQKADSHMHGTDNSHGTTDN